MTGYYAPIDYDTAIAIDDVGGTFNQRLEFRFDDGAFGYIVGPGFSPLPSGSTIFTIKVWDATLTAIYSQTFDFSTIYGYSNVWMNTSSPSRACSDRVLLALAGDTATHSGLALVAVEVTNAGGSISVSHHGYSWADISSNLTDTLPSGGTYAPGSWPQAPARVGTRTWVLYQAGSQVTDTGGTTTIDSIVVVDMASGALTTRLVGPADGSHTQYQLAFAPSVFSQLGTSMAGCVQVVGSTTRNLCRVGSSGGLSSPLASSTDSNAKLQPVTAIAAAWSVWRDDSSFHWVTSTTFDAITDAETIHLLAHGWGGQNAPLYGRGPSDELWMQVGGSGGYIRHYRRQSGALVFIDDGVLVSESWTDSWDTRAVPLVPVDWDHVLGEANRYPRTGGTGSVYRLGLCAAIEAPVDVGPPSDLVSFVDFKDDLLATNTWEYDTGHTEIFKHSVRSFAACAQPGGRVYAVVGYESGKPVVVVLQVNGSGGVDKLVEDTTDYGVSAFTTNFVNGPAACAVVTDSGGTQWLIVPVVYSPFPTRSIYFMARRLDGSGFPTGSWVATFWGSAPTFQMHGTGGSTMLYVDLTNHSVFRLSVNTSGVVSIADSVILSSSIGVFSSYRDYDNHAVVVTALAGYPTSTAYLLSFADGAPVTSWTETSVSTDQSHVVSGSRGADAVGNGLATTRGFVLGYANHGWDPPRYSDGRFNLQSAFLTRSLKTGAVQEASWFAVPETSMEQDTRTPGISTLVALGGHTLGVGMGVDRIDPPYVGASDEEVWNEDITDVLSFYLIRPDLTVDYASWRMPTSALAYERWYVAKPQFLQSPQYDAGCVGLPVLDSAGKHTNSVVVVGNSSFFVFQDANYNAYLGGPYLQDPAIFPGGPYFSVEDYRLWAMKVDLNLPGAFQLRVGTIALD